MLKSEVSSFFSFAVTCYLGAFQRVHSLVIISYLLNIKVFKAGTKVRLHRRGSGGDAKKRAPLFQEARFYIEDVSI